MNNIHDMDLNLLVAFVRIYEARSVTKAAQQGRITQSAMSHALGRLRSGFGDVLFVRNGHSLEPTPKADTLYGPIQEALARLDEVISGGVDFNPKTDTARFEIAMADYVELACLSKIAAALANDAPGVSLVSTDIGNQDLSSALTQMDLVIARNDKVPANYHRQTLWQEGFLTICSQDHPRIGKQISVTEFLAEGHVMVGTGGQGRGAVDRALAQQGLKRKVALVTGFFHSPPRVVAESELIATVPSSLATRMAQELPIKVLAPPLDLPSFDVSMVWSPRKHGDQAHMWFRRWLKTVVSTKAEG